jgi:hypothetical protein
MSSRFVCSTRFRNLSGLFAFSTASSHVSENSVSYPTIFPCTRLVSAIPHGLAVPPHLPACARLASRPDGNERDKSHRSQAKSKCRASESCPQTECCPPIPSCLLQGGPRHSGPRMIRQFNAPVNTPPLSFPRSMPHFPQR